MEISSVFFNSFYHHHSSNTEYHVSVNVEWPMPPIICSSQYRLTCTLLHQCNSRQGRPALRKVLYILQKILNISEAQCLRRASLVLTIYMWDWWYINKRYNNNAMACNTKLHFWVRKCTWMDGLFASCVMAENAIMLYINVEQNLFIYLYITGIIIL